MLDHFSSQASGLWGMTNRQGPRVLAVVNHGDDQAELPLLWQLCQALVNFGYAVTVLDGTTQESRENPGLAQLLDNRSWHDEPVRDALAWTVLPCGLGLPDLCAQTKVGTPRLQRLASLLHTNGVVIVYCKAEWMADLLGHSPIEPLLAVSPLRTSLMTGYVALKRLLISGSLKPTIANMVEDADPDGLTTASAVSLGLSECAKRFLGQDVKTLDIAIQSSDAPPSGAMQRLALRLLEGAMDLRAAPAPTPLVGRSRPMGTVLQHGEMH